MYSVPVPTFASHFRIPRERTRCHWSELIFSGIPGTASGPATLRSLRSPQPSRHRIASHSPVYSRSCQHANDSAIGGSCAHKVVAPLFLRPRRSQRTRIRRSPISSLAALFHGNISVLRNARCDTRGFCQPATASRSSSVIRRLPCGLFASQLNDRCRQRRCIDPVNRTIALCPPHTPPATVRHFDLSPRTFRVHAPPHDAAAQGF